MNRHLEELTNEELRSLHHDKVYEISKYKNFQQALKIQLNSAYGAMGSEYFRYYDIRLAEAVTLSGQLVIRTLFSTINAYINKVLETDNDYIIAGDTDSLYICLDELVKRVYAEKKDVPTEKVVDFLDKLCANKINEVIKKTCASMASYMNVFKPRMSMKRESIADKAIWTEKKRYILNVWDSEGVRYNEPKMKIMGIEAIKSTTPEVCRVKMKEAIKVILSGDQNKLHKFIDDFEKEFRKYRPEDIATPKGCNGVEKYSDPKTVFKTKCPFHVRGALHFNRLLR